MTINHLERLIRAARSQGEAALIRRPLAIVENRWDDAVRDGGEFADCVYAERILRHLVDLRMSGAVPAAEAR